MFKRSIIKVIWGEGLQLAIRLMPVNHCHLETHSFRSVPRSGHYETGLPYDPLHNKTSARAQRHDLLHTEESLCLLSERDKYPQQGLHLQRKAKLAADRGGGAARLSTQGGLFLWCFSISWIRSSFRGLCGVIFSRIVSIVRGVVACRHRISNFARRLIGRDHM
jgi:hypothetical protein